MSTPVSFLRLFVFTFLVTLFTNCQFTLTTPPDFKSDGNAALKAIQAAYKAEKLDVTRATLSGDEAAGVLTIKVINAQQLPEGDALYEAGNRIFRQVKEVLEHPEAYKTCKVVFVTKRGGSIAHTSRSTGYEYPF